MLHHLVIFAAFYPPFTGGYAKSVRALAERVARRGWRVTVVSTDTNGGAAQALEGGVAVVRLPAWNALGTYPIPKPSLRLLRILGRLFRTPVDIVSTQTRFFPTSWLGMVFAWCKRAPIVHTERGSVHTASDKRHVRSINLIADHTLGALLVRTARRCVGVSRAAVSFCRHLGATRTVVIPNGIVTADYRKRGRTSQSDRVRIVYLGRLIWAKGVQDLLDAVAALRRSDFPVTLDIVGSGVFEAELRSMVETLELRSVVRFLGEQQPAEIPSVLATADIMVNPSYSEGLPTSVLEAAATGCAIVATDVGGTSEIVQGGETGILIPPKDRAALIDALTTLIREPALRARLGTAARDFVAARFDWEAVTDAYLSLFAELQR